MYIYIYIYIHVCVRARMCVCYCMFQAHVRIWNSISLNTLKVIGIGLFERAVCCITFSKLVCMNS